MSEKRGLADKVNTVRSSLNFNHTILFLPRRFKDQKGKFKENTREDAIRIFRESNAELTSETETMFYGTPLSKTENNQNVEICDICNHSKALHWSSGFCSVPGCRCKSIK